MNDTHRVTKQRPLGFTLVELMIAIAVLAIIAAIAYPNYMNSVRKANRAEAKAALTELAGRQEQFYLNRKRYAKNFSELGWSDPAYTENDLYELLDDDFHTYRYTLTASPRGRQQADVDCYTFTLDQLGERANKDSGGSVLTNDCW